MGSRVGCIGQHPAVAELPNGNRRVIFASPRGNDFAAVAGQHAVEAQDRRHGRQVEAFQDGVLFRYRFGAKAFGALAQVFVVQTAHGQNLAQRRAPPAAFAELTVEAQPAPEEHHVRSGLDRLDGQPRAIGKREHPCAEQFAVEERRIELEIFGLDIGKNHNVVFGEYFLESTRFHVIEIPGRHALDLKFAAGLDRFEQPMAVVDHIQPLGGMIKRCLRIDRPQLDGPVANVIDLFDG